MKAENLLLQKLSNNKPHSFPIPQNNVQGESITVIENSFLRLLSFVEGDFLAEAQHTPELFYF
ncbi:MAG: hypothetical protein ACR2MD_09060 [Aridibacter sp.]